MNLVSIFFIVILFVALTPGVLIKLPKKNTKLLYIAITHGILFATIWFIYCFIYKKYFKNNKEIEGFRYNPNKSVQAELKRNIMIDKRIVSNSVKKLINDTLKLERIQRSVINRNRKRKRVERTTQ